jgi:hypothetical protein
VCPDWHQVSAEERVFETNPDQTDWQGIRKTEGVEGEIRVLEG